MAKINHSLTQEAVLRDDIAEALERAGLWRRAATCWLHVFDSLNSDKGRERIAQRREAYLLIASRYADRNSSCLHPALKLCVMPLPFPRGRARPSAQITVTNPYFYHRSLRNDGEPATKSASLPLFSLPLTANFVCSHCCKISRA
ncbi:PerC family transcriptional regulator [Salmonella enterica]|nr:PerC family transcriptional regulator [Salmonella enterica]